MFNCLTTQLQKFALLTLVHLRIKLILCIQAQGHNNCRRSFLVHLNNVDNIKNILASADLNSDGLVLVLDDFYHDSNDSVCDSGVGDVIGTNGSEQVNITRLNGIH